MKGKSSISVVKVRNNNINKTELHFGLTVEQIEIFEDQNRIHQNEVLTKYICFWFIIYVELFWHLKVSCVSRLVIKRKN